MAFNKETGLYEGYIYKITNNINGKVYIGLTTRTTELRFKEHCKGANLTNKNKIQVVDYAIKKYGKENFEVLTLEKFSCKSKKELLEKLKKNEIQYIHMYQSTNKDNGYNITKGGDSCISSQNKPVWKYKLDGTFICEYKSLGEAALANNISKQDLSHCCNKIRSVSVGGYLWSFKGENYRTDTYIKNRKVCEYDLNGVLLNEYSCINDITDDKNVRHKITNCCGGYTYNVNGLVYRYESDSFDKYQCIPSRKGGHSKQKCPVIQYDLDWNIINKFQSVKEAHEITKINMCGITDCCKNRRDKIFEYRFQYA